MARAMTADNTEIYRALVSRKLPNGKVTQIAYGPQASKAHAQDRGRSWEDAPSKVEKQVLRPNEDCQLYWFTIEIKYTNGGEDVNWDAE